MTKNEIDVKNMQVILDRIKNLQGLVYQKEVREIIAKYPDANNFGITQSKEGENKSFHGKKIRSYFLSEEQVFILVAHSERGEGEDKKYYSSYFKFDINAKTEENDTTEE